MASYAERRCALRWQLVLWGLGLPAVLAAAVAWLIMFGGSHDAIASVVSSLLGLGSVAALIGCGLLYRNWPTGIRMDEAGVSIGAVGSRRATAREWVAPTRQPDELRAFLASIGRGLDPEHIFVV